jgi:hypothetical protein
MAQLIPLGDASLTVIDRSSSELLGVSVTVLNEALTGHQLRELLTRARGSPLVLQSGFVIYSFGLC